MKINRVTIGIVAAAALGIVFGGCSARGGLVPSGPSASLPSFVSDAASTSYKQIELLSRPAVKEAFELFEDHDKTNRAEPYKDPTLQGQIKSFALNFRSETTAATLQAVLYPNEMKIDLSQDTNKAAYLGVESGGATGSKFGGRALSDDVIDISLGALFGNTLSALKVIPDDKKEVPCLTTDNVAYDKQNTTTFPYIQSPL
jgi:hypothetical protein